MTQSYETSLDAALSNLRLARKILLDDIAGYPSPISGCDIQFNTLLSDRKRISRALQALEDHPFIPTPRILERGTVSESR